MKKMKYLSAILAGVMSIGSIAYAEISAETNTDSQSIRLWGDTDYENTNVSVRLEKGEDYFLLKQFKTNSDGGFDFEYPLSIPTGDYTIKLRFTGKELWTDTVTFVNAGDVVTLNNNIKNELELLKAAENPDYTTLKGLIEANRDILPEINFADYDLISAVITDGKSEIDEVYTYVIGNDVPDSLGNFTKLINKGILIKKVISSGDKSIFEQNAAEMGINTLSGYSVYQGLSEAGKAEVVNALNIMPKTDMDLTDAFIKCTLIKGLKEKSYREYDGIITACSEAIEVAALQRYNSLTSSNKVTAAKLLSEKPITDYASFLTAFSEAINTVSAASVRPSGGGGGGGSSKAPVSGVVATQPQEDNKKTATFADLSRFGWAEESISALYNKGIVAGKSQTEFCPADKITKEEFLALILRGFGVKEAEGYSTFSDVDKNAWYAKTVATGESMGIVSGIGENIFGAGRPITRQEMCVIAHRVAKMNSVSFKNEEAAPFEDSIADWATEAISELYASGIVSGVGDRQFMPESGATRAEASVVIYKLLTFAKWI